MKKVLVIGGPGTISRGTLADLVQKGVETAVLTTKRDGKVLDDHIRCFWGDRNDRALLKACIGTFKPDAIIDTICYFKEQAETLHELTRGKIGQLIFISTVVVYGPTATASQPVREEYPALVGEQNSYGWNKLLCERFYASKFESEGFPVTIVRPAYSFGPKIIIGVFADGYTFLKRLRDGLPIAVPSSGETVMQACPGKDVGRMIALMSLGSQPAGQIYNLAHETYITHDDYIRHFAHAFGRTPEIVHIPIDAIRLYGDPDMLKAAMHSGHQSSVFSVEKFKADFPAFTWSPLQPAFDETVAECAAMGFLDGPAERTGSDVMIERWKAALTGFKRPET